jgi:hypothetical protein
VQGTNVTDNLLVVVIVHGLYDFLVLLYLLRGPGSTTPTEESGIKDQEEEVEGPESGESTEYGVPRTRYSVRNTTHGICFTPCHFPRTTDS